MPVSRVKLVAVCNARAPACIILRAASRAGGACVAHLLKGSHIYTPHTAAVQAIIKDVKDHGHRVRSQSSRMQQTSLIISDAPHVIGKSESQLQTVLAQNWLSTHNRIDWHSIILSPGRKATFHEAAIYSIWLTTSSSRQHKVVSLPGEMDTTPKCYMGAEYQEKAKRCV